MYKLENNVEWTEELKDAFKHNVTRAKIIYDNIGEVSGEGENIILNDTMQKKFKIAPLPRGNSEQDGEPSPTNEVPISNVTGDVEVLVQNKNLFDRNASLNGWQLTKENYQNGIKLTSTANSGVCYIKYTFPFVHSTVQNIYLNFIKSGTGFVNIYFYDENGNTTRSTSNQTSSFSLSNIPVTTKTVDIYFYGDTSSTGAITIFDNIQLELGTTATTYTPHQEQTFLFPLGTQRLMLGDYLADDGIHHVRGTMTFDGTENWYNYTPTYEGYYAGYTSKHFGRTGNFEENILCNYFENLALTSDNPTLRGTMYATYIKIPSNIASNMAELKTWLSTHNVTVEYELAEEEITPYTTAQQTAYNEIKQAISYEEQTNISGSSEEANPIFNVTAYSTITTETEITYDNGIKEITLEDNVYVPDLGFIGQAVAKKVTLTLLDNEQTTNLENKEFELYIGADYNGQTYYINYGNFIVNEAPENDSTNGTIKIIAYDYMIKFNKIYEDQVIYPLTLKNYLINICQQAGVELGTQSFNNDSFLVTDNQFEGKQLREVLKHIGKCAFSWARIGQDNKLYLDFENTDVEEVTETFTINDYKLNGYKKANEYYGPINKVTYGDTDIEGQELSVQDNASVLIHGVKEFIINDNYFAYTAEKRQSLINNGICLFGFTYMPVTQLELTGAIYLDCTDIIKIEDENGNDIVTRVLNHNIKYNGIISDNIESPSISDNQRTYENTNAPVNAANRTEIIVDRANQKIQTITEEIGDRSQKTTTITQDIEGIESLVQDIEDLTNTITELKTVVISDAYPRS